MKKIIKTLTLVTTGLIVGVVVGRVRDKENTYTITDLEDNLLVDISNNQIINSETVKVFVNGKLP